MGKVGTGQYYCWDCFIEFSLAAKGGPHLYRIDPEGTLVAFGSDEGTRSSADQDVGASSRIS